MHDLASSLLIISYTFLLQEKGKQGTWEIRCESDTYTLLFDCHFSLLCLISIQKTSHYTLLLICYITLLCFISL